MNTIHRATTGFRKRDQTTTQMKEWGKAIVGVMAAIVIIPAMATTTSAQNLLADPGAEQELMAPNPNRTGVSGWSMFSGVFFLTTPQAHSGTNVLYTPNSGGGYSLPGCYQLFAATAGQTFVLSGWVYTPNLLVSNSNDFAILQLQFFTGALPNNYGGDTAVGPVIGVNVGTPIGPGPTTVPLPQGVWTYASVTGTAMNVGANHVNSMGAYLLDINADANADFYFDDVSLTLLPATGPVNSWTDGSGKWETPGNWSGGAPSISDSADLITNASSKVVTIDLSTTTNAGGATMTISNLTVSGFGGGINTLQLTNAGTITPLHVFSTMTISTGGVVLVSNSVAVVDSVSGNGSLGFYNGTGLYVGNNGLGTLTVNGGTIIVDEATLGLNSGSTGTVWLTGGNWQGGVVIGQNGVGRMTVSNGTLLATVGVGTFGGGTLTVAGGTNTVLGLTIGYAANGAVWMTGGQMTVTNAFTIIGYNGNGQMTVSNGTWLARDVDLGENNAGGTLTLAGGTNTLSSVLDIGFSVASSVWVSGGQLTVTNAAIYVGDGDVGQMTVSNGTVVGRDVHVGYGAPGFLTIPGGTMSAFSNLVVGDCGASVSGVVSIVGGSLFMTNAAGNAVLDVRDGTVTLGSGLLKVDKIVMTNSCGHLVHTGGTLLYSQLNLDPNLSASGIPNGWALQYGLDPFDPNLASEDPDHDGFSNLQEYQAGTNPNDPNSKPLRITAVARQGGDFKITWLTLGGTTNTVQATSGTVNGSFNTNNFADIVGSQAIIHGIGPVTTNYTESGGATNVPARYYRIRLVP